MPVPVTVPIPAGYRPARNATLARHVNVACNALDPGVSVAMLVTGRDSRSIRSDGRTAITSSWSVPAPRLVAMLSSP